MTIRTALTMAALAVSWSACDTGGTGGPDGGGQDGGQDAGSSGDAGTTEMSFAADIQPILNTECVVCHKPAAAGGSPNAVAAVNLEAPAHSKLVNVAASAGCDPSFVLVKPGDKAASMLWKKIANQAPCKMSPMPAGTSGLKFTNPAAFKKIEDWITQGAKNN